MTVLLFALVVILVGVGVRLAIHAAVLPRVQLSMHLRGIQGYGFGGDVAGTEKPKRLDAAVTKLVEGIGRWAISRITALQPLSRGDLTAAGYYELAPELVHGYRVLAALGLPLLLGFLLFSGGSFSMISILIVLASAAAGWMLPALLITSKGRKRLDDIDRMLPDLVDLLTATVEAGMGVAASFSLVATRFSGALGDELRLTLKQQTLGMSLSEALTDMVERCDTPSVRAFVRTVTRGEALGVSIGPILRELAADTRRRRRHVAQEKMHKAPVKLLFPLMFLIFPALFLELLYPAAYQLIHTLG
jgi:tight adherence protein C